MFSRWLFRPIRSFNFHFQRPVSALRPQPLRFLHVTTPLRRPRLRRDQYQSQSQYEHSQRYGIEYDSNIFQRWAARPSFYYQVGGLGAIGGFFYIYNLEAVPVSGRRRFNVISAETEEATSAQMFEQIRKEYGDKILPSWDKRTEQVQRVLDRLIPSSGLVESHWEVFVIDEPKEKNAFVIPGGKVFVFTGILPICANDDGLAAVLGHEIAHNVAHHAAERMSQGLVLFAGVWLLRIVSLVTTGYVLSEADWATQWILDLTFTKPGSRKQESEADYIGLMMAAQSCYDPREAVRVWARMAAAATHAPPQFLSTHPSDQTRMKTIEGWLPEAFRKLEASSCGLTIEYAQQFKEAVNDSLT